jgi:hypothetical protein
VIRFAPPRRRVRRRLHRCIRPLECGASTGSPRTRDKLPRLPATTAFKKKITEGVATGRGVTNVARGWGTDGRPACERAQGKRHPITRTHEGARRCLTSRSTPLPRSRPSTWTARASRRPSGPRCCGSPRVRVQGLGGGRERLAGDDPGAPQAHLPQGPRRRRSGDHLGPPVHLAPGARQRREGRAACGHAGADRGRGLADRRGPLAARLVGSGPSGAAGNGFWRLDVATGRDAERILAASSRGGRDDTNGGRVRGASRSSAPRAAPSSGQNPATPSRTARPSKRTASTCSSQPRLWR